MRLNSPSSLAEALKPIQPPSLPTLTSRHHTGVLTPLNKVSVYLLLRMRDTRLLFTLEPITQQQGLVLRSEANRPNHACSEPHVAYEHDR